MLNPFDLLRSLVDSAERLSSSRLAGVASRTASGVTSRLRALEDYIPLELRSRFGGNSAQYLSPVEVAKIYAQLPEREKDAISEQLKLAASDAFTTMEGFAPLGASLTHRAVGRLVFQCDGPDGKPLPLHNMLVELWDRDFGSDDILSRNTTDKNGQFELWYDPADAGKWERPDLELRVFDIQPVYKKGKLHFRQQLVYSIRGDRNVSRQSYDFGECRVPYWEYDPAATTPRLLVVHNSIGPQAFSPMRSLVMAMELAPLQIKKLAHIASRASIPDIQRDYPENLTIRLERESPGSTRSDEFFGERLLNGMTASIMDRDPKKRDRFWIHHHWNSYEQDGVHAAPNVDIHLRVKNDKLLPVKIQLQFRKRGDLSAKPEMDSPLTFKPSDGSSWLQAKRVARVSAALHAELDVHLGQTHLNMEQYAVAAHRNLRKSPIRVMLAPHLKETVLINQEADRWLLGETGLVTQSQALTSDAVNTRLRQVLGTLDWKGWRPRQTICEQHTYAKAALLIWQALKQYVDAFVAEHEKRIKKYWFEVHSFSTDLVDHSAPVYLCPFLADQRGAGGGNLPDWFEPNERMDLTDRCIDGRERAVSPITASDEFKDGGDLENLKQVCRYVIFHTTFFHYWLSSQQYDDGGELVYSGLGLRYGDQGVLTAEDDYSVLPPPHVATEQLWFAKVLSTTNYGFILSNEDRDIAPGLPDALRTRQKALAALGLDIHKIPSRMNI